MQNFIGEEFRLRDLIGDQYILWYSSPPLHIICKQRRTDSNTVSPLAYYYVINGNVHQAPDMYSTIQSRLLGCLGSLQSAFSEMSNLSRYNAAQGYYWDLEHQPCIEETEEKQKEEKSEALVERSNHFQKTRTNTIMNQLFDEISPIETPEIKKKTKIEQNSRKNDEIKLIKQKEREYVSSQFEVCSGSINNMLGAPESVEKQLGVSDDSKQDKSRSEEWKASKFDEEQVETISNSENVELKNSDFVEMSEVTRRPKRDESERGKCAESIVSRTASKCKIKEVPKQGEMPGILNSDERNLKESESFEFETPSGSDGITFILKKLTAPKSNRSNNRAKKNRR